MLPIYVMFLNPIFLPIVIIDGIIKKKKKKTLFSIKKRYLGRLVPTPQPGFEERELYRLK